MAVGEGDFMNNWMSCIIVSIISRLIGLVAILGFVFHLILFTNNLHCLWLLFLAFLLEYIPTYEFKRELPINKENKYGN